MVVSKSKWWSSRQCTKGSGEGYESSTNAPMLFWQGSAFSPSDWTRLKFGLRALGGKPALEIPVDHISMGRHRRETAYLRDSSLASSSCLFSLISRWTFNSISRSWTHWDWINHVMNHTHFFLLLAQLFFLEADALGGQLLRKNGRIAAQRACYCLEPWTNDTLTSGPRERSWTTSPCGTFPALRVGRRNWRNDVMERTHV